MPLRSGTSVVLASSLALLLGCDRPMERDCSTADTTAAGELPARLSETGLYRDIAADAVADRAIEFRPRFPLWTDGAEKRRWLLLPEAGVVDTSDPGDWVFPVGTKFFKEFRRDGVRLETRMNTRTELQWTAVTYLWDGDGDAARILDAVVDAGGTEHDIPSAAECLACHAGRRNFTLGFSATQLDPAVRTQLFADGVLSDPVDDDFDLAEAAALGLGVLHGNCSHCHNAARDEQPQATLCYTPSAAERDDDDPVDFTLPHDLAAVEDAPAVQTGRWLLTGDGDDGVLGRMGERNTSLFDPSMPPLGTEIVDTQGVVAVEAFVAELPSGGR